MGALAVTSLLTLGCNSLTGLESYGVEEADPEEVAASTGSAGEGATGGAVGIGDKPAPGLLNCAWPEGGEVGGRRRRQRRQ